MTSLVAGVGSDIMSDDAIGHEVIKALEKASCECDLAYLGTDIFRLHLHYRGHERVIVVDALKGVDPGSVHVFYQDDFHRLDGFIRHSHLLGIIEALNIMSLITPGLSEAKKIVVGVGAETIQPGMELSPAAKKGVALAVEKIMAILNSQ